MSELSILLELVKQHIDDDTRRFDEQNDKLAEIGADVKSLLANRAERKGRGAVISAIVSAVVAFAIAKLTH